jgi:predicted ATPase/DNA-binding winged helix-turn-helix (wHTH) protein
MTPILRFGPCELRPAQRMLWVHGQPAKLGARAFDVLLALIERRERVVTKDELLDTVWPNVVVEENNLQVQISALRKLLGAQVIATIPGRGYRFAAELTDAPTPVAQTPAAPTPAECTAGETMRTNLPDVVPPLIGREPDVAAVTALMAQHRLVTLVGAGGVGKSRLAQWLLHQRRSDFAHSVAWIDLAPLADASRLVEHMAAALGVSLGAADALQALVGALRPMQALIALDNAEHVLDAVAQTVAVLHDAAPGIRLVLTSQAPLALGAEQVYRLAPHAVPPQDASVPQALAHGAVALFVARAQAVDRRFTLDERNVRAVVDICRRLDGLALAVELAAARVGLLGAAALARGLDERFAVLTAGKRDAPARQQALHAALQWSHDLLTEPERIVLRRLAVCASSFGLELAQQVAADAAVDPWAVVDALAGLVDRSWITVDGAAPRYRLLETPRAFALQRLDAAGEAAPVRRAHAQAMRVLLDRAYAQYFSGQRPIDDWRSALYADADNAREALQWGLAHDAHTAVAIAAVLALAWSSASMHEARHALDATAQFITDAVPADVRARWHVEAALVWSTTRPAYAQQQAHQAAALYRSLDDRRGLYRALSLTVTCNAQAAVDEHQRSLAQLQAIEDPGWPSVVRERGAEAAAMVHLARGDFAQAMASDHLRDALLAQAGDSTHRLIAQINLMNVELAAGQAADAARRGVALRTQLRATRHVAALNTTELNLSAAYLAQDDAHTAREVAQSAWPQALLCDMQAYWADYLALIAALEGRMHAAAQLLGYSDAGYAAKQWTREVNEHRAVERAEQLVRGTLDAAAFDVERERGRGLADHQAQLVAFGAQEAVRDAPA